MMGGFSHEFLIIDWTDAKISLMSSASSADDKFSFIEAA